MGNVLVCVNFSNTQNSIRNAENWYVCQKAPTVPKYWAWGEEKRTGSNICSSHLQSYINNSLLSTVLVYLKFFWQPTQNGKSPKRDLKGKRGSYITSLALPWMASKHFFSFVQGTGFNVNISSGSLYSGKWRMWPFVECILAELLMFWNKDNLFMIFGYFKGPLLSYPSYHPSYFSLLKRNLTEMWSSFAQG